MPYEPMSSLTKYTISHLKWRDQREGNTKVCKAHYLAQSALIRCKAHISGTKRFKARYLVQRAFIGTARIKWHRFNLYRSRLIDTVRVFDVIYFSNVTVPER